MSKPVKNLIVDTYRKRFDGIDSAIMISIRGLAANKNNTLRKDLAGQQIRVTLVKNSLAKQAWQGTGLENLCQLLQGACAVAYGNNAVEMARLLIDQAKQTQFEFKGALMEGELFGPDEVEALSKYPTREEAQGQVIGVALSPAGQIIGAATSAGAQIASILSTIEKKLEDESKEQ